MFYSDLVLVTSLLPQVLDEFLGEDSSENFTLKIFEQKLSLRDFQIQLPHYLVDVVNDENHEVLRIQLFTDLEWVSRNFNTETSSIYFDKDKFIKEKKLTEYSYDSETKSITFYSRVIFNYLLR